MLLVECEASGDGKCPLPQLVIYVCGLLRGGVEDCARTGRRAQYIDHVSIEFTLDKIITRTVRIGHKLPELVVYVRGLLRGGVEDCARTGRRAQYIDHVSIDLTLDKIITRTVRIGHKLPELVVYVRGLLRGGVENCARTGRRA